MMDVRWWIWGYKMQDARYRMQDKKECMMLDMGCKDTRYKIQDAGYGMQDVLSHRSAVAHALPCSAVVFGRPRTHRSYKAIAFDVILNLDEDP